MALQRGKKSAAALATPMQTIAPREAYAAPSELTEVQADLWNRLMLSNSKAIIDSGNFSILAAYVRTVDFCNQLAVQVNAIKPEDWSHPEKFKRIEKLLRQHSDHVKTLASLATKLRIAPSSAMTSKQAGRIIDAAEARSDRTLSPMVRPSSRNH